jgi:putative colanic acid biosynthesis acetyltransferase WcaF
MVQLWSIIQATLFRASPQVLYGWHRFLLRLFRCSLGKGTLVRPTVEVKYPWKVSIGDRSWTDHDATLYSLGEIHIGANVVVSEGSYLCTATHMICKVPVSIFMTSPSSSKTISGLRPMFSSRPACAAEGPAVDARGTVLHDLPRLMVFFGRRHMHLLRSYLEMTGAQRTAMRFSAHRCFEQRFKIHKASKSLRRVL